MQSNKDVQKGSGSHGMALRKRHGTQEVVPVVPSKRTKLSHESSKRTKPKEKPLTKKHITDPKMIKKMIEKAKKVLLSKQHSSSKANIQKRQSFPPKKDSLDATILPMPEPEIATKEWYRKTTDQ